MRYRVVLDMDLEDEATFPPGDANLDEMVQEYLGDLIKELPDVTVKRIAAKRI